MTGPVPEVRWEVVGLLLACDLKLSDRLGYRVHDDDGRAFTVAKNALADGATEAERLAVLIWRQQEVARLRAELAMLCRAEYRDYRRRRAGRRGWDRTRPQAPLARSGP